MSHLYLYTKYCDISKNSRSIYLNQRMIIIVLSCALNIWQCILSTSISTYCTTQRICEYEVPFLLPGGQAGLEDLWVAMDYTKINSQRNRKMPVNNKLADRGLGQATMSTMTLGLGNSTLASMGILLLLYSRLGIITNRDLLTWF